MSRIEITPPEGSLMGGYVSRTKPSTGVHDALYARAVSLADGDERALAISAELLCLDVGLAHAVRSRIAEATGIPASHIIIACSHTHSGPLVVERRLDAPDSSYIRRLQDKLVEVAVEASGSLQPLRVGSGSAKLHLGVNRRQLNEANRAVVGKNPRGYVDPYSRIVVLAKENGAPLAVIFTYAAHPMVLGPENLEISGDYAGMAAREIEANFGDSAVALFCQGFGGNVNVDCEARDFGEVETIGVALARAVLEEIKDIRLTRDAPLRVCCMDVPLPLEPPPSPLEAEQRLYDARQELAGVLGRGQGKSDVQERRAAVDWAAQVAQLAGRNDLPSSVELEMQALVLGGTAMVALSAEVFAEYSRTLAEVSPFELTVPVSNANGSIGYLPTAAAFEEGGYEVETAPSVRGVLGLRPDTEPIVCDALARLLAEAAQAPEPLAREQA